MAASNSALTRKEHENYNIIQGPKRYVHKEGRRYRNSESVYNRRDLHATVTNISRDDVSATNIRSTTSAENELSDGDKETDAAPRIDSKESKKIIVSGKASEKGESSFNSEQDVELLPLEIPADFHMHIDILTRSQVLSSVWVLDSGAPWHITHDKRNLDQFKECALTAGTASKTGKLAIQGAGKTTLMLNAPNGIPTELAMERSWTFLATDATNNLMSLSILDKHGLKGLWGNGRIEIQAGDGRVIGVATLKQSGHYVLDMFPDLYQPQGLQGSDKSCGANGQPFKVHV